jgi:hypothetical protein
LDCPTRRKKIMAIVSLNSAYTKTNMPTYNGGVGELKSDYNNITKAADFKLYRTDETTRKEFPKAVGVENPVYGTFETSDGYDNQSLRDHVYQYINKYKVCEIAYGSAGDILAYSPADTRWGNWRTKNPGDIKVFPNVFLFPDEKTFQFSYSNTYGEAWEAVDPGGVISKISQAAEAARSFQALTGKVSENVAGKLMSRYKRAPSWTGTDPIKLGTNLKFTFQFGQAGVFSGEHEVVRPILALASLWVPIKTGDHYYRGTLPTPPYFQMTALKTFSKEGMSGIGSAVSSGEGGVISTITSIEQTLIGIQENSIKIALETSGSRAIFIRMGRMVMGPYIVKEVNWDFDFSQTDDYGFPFKGSINIGGLESSIMPDPGQITHVWNLGTNLENENFTEQSIKDLYKEENTIHDDKAATPANNASGQSSGGGGGGGIRAAGQSTGSAARGG